MEFIDGVKKKDTLDIHDILESGFEGEEIRINGAVHSIRDMGEVAFVILRKAQGLVQCVYEPGVTDFELHKLREESAVEVLGTVKKEERSPHGFEIRLKEIKVLSKPAEPLPVPVSKWKLNTSLETKLALRPVSLRNIRERARFRIQEGIVRGLRRFTRRRSLPEGQREAPMFLSWITLENGQSWARVPSFTNRLWPGSLTGCLRRPLYSGQRSTIPQDI